VKRIVGVVIVALLVGGGCWFFGLGPVPAIVVALVVGALGALVRVLPPPVPDREWPPGPPLRFDGARRETSELSWSLRTRGGGVGTGVATRVRIIAANRLALRQLDLDNPAHRAAIERLIGAETYQLLSDPERPVRLATVLRVLDILDALDVAARPTEPTRRENHA
jgi:hypothetical protein